MLWDVRHEWPSGVQFTFTCYRHWDTLVVRDTGDGSGHFLHSKEGVTQGDPFAIIVYGIGVIPLIWGLWVAHPCVTQPWYPDDAGQGVSSNTAPGDKDWGLADSASVHNKWDISGGTGMV